MQSVLHPLKSLPHPGARQPPRPAPGSHTAGAHGNPQGEISPWPPQRGGKHSLAAAPDICRDLGSLQACGVSSLPLSQAVEDVQKHPSTAAPHTWHVSPARS